MSCATASFKDREELVFNPLTGQFDMVSRFNENRIVTHRFNSAGSQLLTFNKDSGQHIGLGYLVVTDNCGNVVAMEGCGCDMLPDCDECGEGDC